MRHIKAMVGFKIKYFLTKAYRKPVVSVSLTEVEQGPCLCAVPPSVDAVRASELTATTLMPGRDTDAPVYLAGVSETMGESMS